MKISVITRHAVSNYGSILQSVATQTVLTRLGHSCEFIDYIPQKETSWNIEKTTLEHKPQWNKSGLRRMVYLAIRCPDSLIASFRFARWRKHRLNLSGRYGNAQQLTESRPEADLYMTGSDQVWGPVCDGTYDPVYCLSFTREQDVRTAYAASFGRSNLDEELQRYYKTWLGRYQQIAVRETQAVSLLEKIGLPAAQVLDPTLLLERTQWDTMAGRKHKKKYILVYQIHNNPRLNDYAKRVAAEKGLPLMRMSASFWQITRGGRFIWLPKPEEFLARIRDAECIITDSFHGTAFAINFHVPFVEVLTENGTQSRNQSILALTGLESRILTRDTDTALAGEPIDYDAVEAILARERSKSMNILKNMIGGV